MKKVFNYVGDVFTGFPTKKLFAEVRQTPYNTNFTSGGFPAILNAYPSAEKVKQIIAKGARVNDTDLLTTPLQVCAQGYRDMMQRATEEPNGLVVIRDYLMTKADWKQIADRYLDVAKALVEAGADPRIGYNGYGTPITPASTVTYKIDAAVVSAFTEVLDNATAKLQAAELRAAETKNLSSVRRHPH